MIADTINRMTIFDMTIIICSYADMTPIKSAHASEIYDSYEGENLLRNKNSLLCSSLLRLLCGVIATCTRFVSKSITECLFVASLTHIEAAVLYASVSL